MLVQWVSARTNSVGFMKRFFWNILEERFGHESDIAITVSYSIFIAATGLLKMFWILFCKQ